MSFQGAPDIQADRATVWRSLLDTNFVARAAPAIESVETVDDTHFKVVAGLGVGALKLRFTMKAELFDIVDGESAKMRVRGKAPGSTLDATTSFRLEDGGPGVIRLHWQADSDVGGTIASVGARLLEGTARRLTEEFWQDFANLVSSEAAG
jgi:carbon monoxide dehydrogenase subunit G